MRTNFKDLIIENTCPFCHRVDCIEVNGSDFYKWSHGMRAQKAFPYLSDNEREMIISGICPTCWDETFKDEEENY